MKKVLIFSLAYYPNAVSGAEGAIKEITDRISDIEFHMVTLRFAPSQPRVETLGNVHIHRVGYSSARMWKILFVPLATLKGLSLHREQHFDALWSVMTYMLFPVVLMKFFVNVPHIVTLQDGDPYEKVFERWFIRPVAPLLNRGFRTAAAVQAISSFLATWPKRRGYTGMVELIYNGANPKNLTEDYSVDEARALAEKWGKKPGDVFLLNASRFVYQKANDNTVRALPLLPKHVKLVLVGGGPDEDMLRALARELGVTDRLIITGRVDRYDVPKYRNRTFADIFVCPSRSEGLQMSSLSAMAGYLPVVSTQAGGLAEYIWDKKHNPDKPKTAWVVDPDSPQQIADAVKEIMANPEEVKLVTEANRAMILKTYNWDTIAQEMRRRVFAPVIG